MVMGPSFCEKTCISAPNSPVCHVKPARAAEGDHPLVERDRGLRPGGQRKAGAAGAAVGKEGELADDQQLGARVGGIDVHFSGLVLKDPQAADLVGDLLRLALGIVLVDAEQDQKALADAADFLAVDDDGGLVDSGNNSAHGISPLISYKLFPFR